MKGTRYTTEEKIRILREADVARRKIPDICRERKISEQTSHRWKREFGMLGKELLKDALKKSCELRPQTHGCQGSGISWSLHDACIVPSPWSSSEHVHL